MKIILFGLLFLVIVWLILCVFMLSDLILRIGVGLGVMGVFFDLCVEVGMVLDISFFW